MENQDHNITSPSGHENHGPPFCHKCGWPFPDQHPSDRHRRAHKKVCGKIEGYELSEPETADNSTHSAVSDDEHDSDGDHRTPSPNGKMTSVKSYRSEDETSSDAVTEIFDSGISPGVEERPESVKRIDDELSNADATGGSRGINADLDPNFLTPYVDDYEEQALLIEDQSPLMGPFPEGQLLLKQEELEQYKEELEEEEEVVGPQEAVPEEIITAVRDGKKFSRIIKKRLTYSDLRKMRFSLPRKQLETEEFLNPSEKEELLEKKSMDIFLQDMEGVKACIKLKVGLGGGSSSTKFNYFLAWKEYLPTSRLGLEEGDMVEIWRLEDKEENTELLIRRVSD